MRFNVEGGNGCICDVCGKKLKPKEAIKIKSYRYECKSIDSYKASYNVKTRCDLCEECYNEKLGDLMYD